MLVTAYASGSELQHERLNPSPERGAMPLALGDPLADSLGVRLAVGMPRTVAAREHIFREGDQACNVYKVEVGHVCIYRIVPDGRRQIIDFAYPGDIIGLGAISTYGANALATTKTRLRSIPISALHAAARSNAELGLSLYEAMARELWAARELLFSLGQRTASERLAAFLMALSHRNERRGDNPAEIVLPMTRIDIADFLGLTIETVSRTFTKFRLAGLIDLEQCVLVTIRDSQALAKLAGESSEAST